MKAPAIVVLILLAWGAGVVRAQEGAPKYRTDGGDEKLPWYHPKRGEFPPADAAHRFVAMLIRYDPFDRSGQYRLDDDVLHPQTQVLDSQAHEIPFQIRPHGMIRYHGAPALLSDIPLGTVLHWRAYKKKDGYYFDQVSDIADDFSISIATGLTFRIEEILGYGIRVTRQREGLTEKEKAPFNLIVDPHTKLYKGRGFAEMKDLAVGQTILLNRGFGTAKLPVVHSCTEIWIDEESRALATDMQRRRNLSDLKMRGLPAIVTEVDNEKSVITVIFTDSGHLQLLKDFKVGRKANVATAEDNLLTYEPAGGQGGPDAEHSDILEVTPVPAVNGSGGVQLRFKPPFLLEGFRPGHVVRICPETFHFHVLSPEERLGWGPR